MALEQHAIPTEVSNYEFRLVGDMTLKQFAWLAGGILLGIIFFMMRILPFFLRWPLIIISITGGIGIAFVPFEGRTLDRWIMAFIKAIYSPTEFIWRKENMPPKIFDVVRIVPVGPSIQQTTTAENQQLQQFIQTLPLVARASSVDEYETSRLSQITQIFNQEDLSLPIPISPDINTNGNATQYNQDITELPQRNEELHDNNFPKIQQIQQTAPSQTNDQTQTPNHELQIVEENTNETLSQNYQTVEQKNPVPMYDQITNYTEPNIISGKIITQQGAPIASALIEITNEQGIPVRALKTNEQGQFAIVTPLSIGVYYLQVEHQHYQFSTIPITVNNQPIPAITITSQI